jgi:hypothetical protein
MRPDTSPSTEVSVYPCLSFMVEVSAVVLSVGLIVGVAVAASRALQAV